MGHLRKNWIPGPNMNPGNMKFSRSLKLKQPWDQNRFSAKAEEWPPLGSPAKISLKKKMFQVALRCPGNTWVPEGSPGRGRRRGHGALSGSWTIHPESLRVLIVSDTLHPAFRTLS